MKLPQMNWRSLLSLKAYVLILFLVIWNGGILFAIHLGGGEFKSGLTPIGMKVTGSLCLALGLFSLAVAKLKPVQSALIAPSRASNFNAKEFYFLAFVAGFLALIQFILSTTGR